MDRSPLHRSTCHSIDLSELNTHVITTTTLLVLCYRCKALSALLHCGLYPLTIKALKLVSMCVNWNQIEKKNHTVGSFANHRNLLIYHDLRLHQWGSVTLCHHVKTVAGEMLPAPIVQPLLAAHIRPVYTHPTVAASGDCTL